MDKKRLFKQINACMLRYDTFLGENIFCPVCWQKFSQADIESNLSIEHVASTSASKLVKEKNLFTLTCKNCNNTYGTRYQNDLKHFLIHQLWEQGKYDGQFSAEVSIEGSPPLICNLEWNPKDENKPIKIIGVPKANNKLISEEHVKILENYVGTQGRGPHFNFNFNFGYKQMNIWSAYIHLAYLTACIKTEYLYAFSNAGRLIRQLLERNTFSTIGWCIIPPQIVDIESWPWLAIVRNPNELSCLWVKVAGNIVIMPNSDTEDIATLYKNWQEVSDITNFGISPKNVPLSLSFFTRQDIIEAKKSLPRYFERISIKK